ncbi:MAG TPA: hypothetical protein VND65_03600 [Candidatus Binatia bacterium]|nr:hypothetical protein [Candidatus Binatia bacterium]
MNSPHIRLVPLLMAVALIFGACEKKKPPAEEILPMDRVAPASASGSQNVLHKTFAITNSTNFTFEVPPHVALPHLHGNYKSFLKELGLQSDDDTANVDFLLLTEDQFHDFSQTGAVEGLFSAPASHDQEVNVSLPATQNLPVKYYLVFRGSPGGAKKKVVQADFTLDY